MKGLEKISSLETKINQIIRLKEALSDFRMSILEQEHQAVTSLKHMADLVVDKSYQVVTMEEHEHKD